MKNDIKSRFKIPSFKKSEEPPVHSHKHYFVQTKYDFEIVDIQKQLYERVEYVLLMCNSPCNDIKKVRLDSPEGIEAMENRK